MIWFEDLHKGQKYKNYLRCVNVEDLLIIII